MRVWRGRAYGSKHYVSICFDETIHPHGVSPMFVKPYAEVYRVHFDNLLLLLFPNYFVAIPCGSTIPAS